MTLLIGINLIGISACTFAPQKPSANVSKIDRISEIELSKLVPHTPSTLTLDEIVKLSSELDADQIIGKLQSSNTFYDLNPTQSIALSKQGVDSKVLDYLYTSYQLALRNNIADEVNRREKEKRAEIEKIKHQHLQLQRYNFNCIDQYRFNPFAFGGYYGHRFGMGAGWPLGCW